MLTTIGATGNLGSTGGLNLAGSATVALANDDARVRFETRSARGNPKRALALLDKLDRSE